MQGSAWKRRGHVAWFLGEAFVYRLEGSEGEPCGRLGEVIPGKGNFSAKALG